MIIDTHCHLTDEAFAADAEACLVRAREAGVQQVVLACCEAADVAPIIAMAQQHPGQVFASLGIHPENMADDIHTQLAAMRTLLQQHASQLVAIGEIGIDLHWDITRLTDQLTVLRTQLDWALEYDLPVLLHIRDAMPQFLDFLRQYVASTPEATQPSARTPRASRLRGVMHCYSGTADEAREAQSLATLLIGVGGTVTYKRSLVPAVVQELGLQNVILETDAPYLAPVPQRGKRNEPAFTAHTAQYLADLMHLDVTDVAQQTTRNAQWLLGIG